MSKILIVDDENDFCEIMKNYFEKKGYDVLLAATLSEGLALIKKEKPDILFLDNNLPDGQGWDSVDEIVEIIPHSRVFLISAHKNKFYSKSKKNNHSITVWEKPISLRVMDDFF
jgi:two-component system OmpR family response regulator